MTSSSALARGLAIAFALLFTPLGLILISVGGLEWSRVLMLGFPVLEALPDLVVPGISFIIGVALLVLVVLSGIWSSAGLIAVGGYALIAIVLAIFPTLLFEVYRGLVGPVPSNWLEALVSGGVLAITVPLAAMGGTLAWLRRRPGSGTLSLLLGVLLCPVLLFGALLLLLWGVGEGQLYAMLTFGGETNPAVILAISGFVLLGVATVALGRWSPFATLIPGVALLLTVVVFFLPEGLPSMVATLLSALQRPVTYLGSMGIFLALGAILISFTPVALRVRAYTPRTAAGPGGHGLGAVTSGRAA